MPTCSSCHRESSADARFCAFCGKPLAEPSSRDTDAAGSDVAIAIQSLTNFSNISDDPRLLTALRPYDEGHFKLAATTLEPLAREGNLVAIFKLGTTFDRLGLTTDAIALWQVAAQQGEPGSQNNLGRVLQERGQMAEAEELFRQSAAQGNPQATYNLSAIMLNRGDKQGYEQLLRDLGRTGSHEIIARAANDWIAFRSAREEPQHTPGAVPAAVLSNDGTVQEPVADEDDEVRSVRAQAARTSALLTELWTEDFPEQFPDVGVDDMLGMALSHAIHKGWIEVDISMSTYLSAAEDLLQSRSVGE